MEINNSFLEKYNVSGPRYTSYPPANFFNEEFSNKDYVTELIASNSQQPQSISIYIHIPFCSQRCHFCGCNTEAIKNEKIISKYVAALKKEMKNTASYLDKKRLVTQIHWGGGTPNSIPLDFVEEIMEEISNNFKISQKVEIAMECSPAYLDFSDIDKLHSFGFNRVSLGVQDFREDVLKTVNRQPPKHPVKEVVDYLHQKGFTGINLDFIYGLPLQTVDSFIKTIEKAIEIRPDRLVTFSYAHVPWVKKAQKILEKTGLPTPETKMSMLRSAINLLENAGYQPIGIDHFALPTDNLALAYRQKKLHRNFQGYCTLETTGQVYGFGSTSIGQLWGGYAQNRKEVISYIEAIEKDGFAISKGYKLNRNEQIIRKVIDDIMCNGILDFKKIASDFDVTISEIRNIVEYNPSKFDGFVHDNLLKIEGDRILLFEKGRIVARNVAMALDPALKSGVSVYSKTI